ncbi:MAG TPA: alpha/beta hydrolase [Acidimicrobiales bacterium]|nr:alpha/beta hydrolase [Acidimicrobiales bacterium]
MRRQAALVLLVAALGACGGDDDAAAPASSTTTTVETAIAPEYERYVDERFREVDVTSDVEYGRAPGVGGEPEALLLDLFQPRGDDEVDRAAVIFAHGGGFGFGDKTQGVSPTLAREFAQLGYVTASINYRLLAPGGCTGASTADNSCSTAALEGIHDGQAAVRWLRANAETYGVDPDRIGIAGESAGGVMAYGAGTWSDAPGESGTPGVSSEVQAFMSLSGGLPGGLFADAGDAPGIFFASVGDPIVPYSWSVDGHRNLTAAGVAAELVTYQGDVHVPFREQRDDIVRRTIDFFAEHLVGSGG